MRKLLVENWARTKSKMLEGLDDNMAVQVGRVLENQRKAMLAENAAQVATTSSDIAGYRKAILPVIRRVIPGTFTNDLVGMQAMDGPTAQVYTMRFKYGEDVNAHEPSWIDSAPHQIGAGDEAFGNESPLRSYYSGSVWDTSSTPVWDTSGSNPVLVTPGVEAGQDAGASGIDLTDPTAAPTPEISSNLATGLGWGSDPNSTYAAGVDSTSLNRPVGGSLYGGGGSFIEGSLGRTMKLELVAQTVEATTRRLQAGWTMEAMQDASSQHGLDIESELAQVLSTQITADIEAEILNDLAQLAGTTRAYDHAATGSATGEYSPAWIGDRFSNIASVIAEVGNEIGRKTRIAAANWIVVSPQIVSMLQVGAKSVFAPGVDGSFKGPSNNMQVGVLNGQYKVYSYLWNQSTSLTGQQHGTGLAPGTDRILVGLKGQNNAECGYVYCPYIPLISTGSIVNPVTGQFTQSLSTRYGKLAFTDKRSSLSNSPDYFGKITMTNLSFV